MKPDGLPALQPNQSARPRVIVCERSGKWGAALRRELPRDISLRETRSLSECVTALREAPASFLVVELTTANTAGVVELLVRLSREHRWARAAIVAERGLADGEWSLREAGAIHFVTSPRKVAELARLATRHAEWVPRPKRSMTLQVWDSLPWPEAAN
jgi:ActR/RegA family two-component response regulator